MAVTRKWLGDVSDPEWGYPDQRGWISSTYLYRIILSSLPSMRLVHYFREQEEILRWSSPPYTLQWLMCAWLNKPPRSSAWHQLCRTAEYCHNRRGNRGVASIDQHYTFNKHWAYSNDLFFRSDYNIHPQVGRTNWELYCSTSIKTWMFIKSSGLSTEPDLCNLFLDLSSSQDFDQNENLTSAS